MTPVEFMLAVGQKRATFFVETIQRIEEFGPQNTLIVQGGDKIAVRAEFTDVVTSILQAEEVAAKRKARNARLYDDAGR